MTPSTGRFPGHTRDFTDGRLTSRPSAAPTDGPAAGVHPLAVDGTTAGLLSVPSEGGQGSHAGPRPLLVLLHGAGGTAGQALDLVSQLPGARGVLLLAPQSRGSTWDAIRGRFGQDVSRIDALLSQVYDRLPVTHTAIGGFSDGASYALTLGQINGDLFSAVLAWSPGFTAARSTTGRPRIYVSHGTYDRVLPIDWCSRQLVPALRAEGYDVAYTEFEGPHVVPPDVAAEGLAMFLGVPAGTVEVPGHARATQPGH